MSFNDIFNKSIQPRGMFCDLAVNRKVIILALIFIKISYFNVSDGPETMVQTKFMIEFVLWCNILWMPRLRANWG